MACRLCLCKIEDMLDPTGFKTTSDKQLMRLIKQYFGFEMTRDPKLSQIVCKYCAERIKSFNQYCEEVRQNQTKVQYMKMDVDEPEDFFTEPVLNIKEEEEQEIYTEKILVEHRPKVVKFNIDRISRFIDFVCEICTSQTHFKGFLPWKSHMKDVHGNDQPTYSCCDVKLINERSFMVHINRYHDPVSSDKLLFECAICLKRFKHKARIRAHMQVHIRHDENGYKCKKCDERFYKSIHWRTHQLLHEPNARLEDILFPCRKCPLEFSSSKDIQVHMRNDHKKNFLCDLCAEVFHAKFVLQEHVRMTHSGPENRRAFQCPHCGNAFLRKNNLTNHISLMHTQTGIYPCNQCDKIAITEKQLKNHIAFTHKTDRRFVCTFCQKAFKRKCDMIDHESIHTGKPLHKCPKCERMFNSKSNMQSHAKRCKDSPEVKFE
ncbi:zinc finger protein 567-like [Culicoides brevitarsis]|uniref:zinc finger protein 567-like n=1 Tax=Culicoides brevitarsis TaxID=469753 RepID=UPI00307C0FF9